MVARLMRRNCRHRAFALAVLLPCVGTASGQTEPGYPFMDSGKPYVLRPSPSVVYPRTFDFESLPNPDDLRVGPSLTTDPDLVIAGEASLLVDSRPWTTEWNEYIHSAEGLRFDSGKTYRVSLKYRVVGDTEFTMYARLRSAATGANDDVDVRFPFWMGIGGIVEEQDILLTPRTDCGDYYLLLGIRGRGAAVIDDLVVDVVSEDIPGEGDRITSHRRPDRATLDYLEDLRAADGMTEIVNDVVVVVLNEGAGGKARDARHRVVEKIQPDWVDWNPIGPLGAEYGIRTTGSEAEYQELYTVESGDVWSRRNELFLHDGFVRDLGGNTWASSTWAAGGYMMCHNAPGWHEWQGNRMLSALAWAEGICQDNIAVATHMSRYGCFCRPCAFKFRDWLGARYAVDELRAWGIDDVASFDPRARWIRHGLYEDRVCRDPVAREYILFLNRSQKEAWGDLVVRAKNRGRADGVRVPTGGNQIFMDGSGVYSPMLSPYNDFIEVEEIASVRTEIANTSWMYRLGAASGYYERPVWVRGPATRKDPDTGRGIEEGILDRYYWTVHLGEALANGGIRAISLGINRPWGHVKGLVQYMDSPGLMDLFARYSSMVRENRAAFSRTRAVARVGLVYSMPTAVWRDARVVEQTKTHFLATQEISRRMDALRIAHDAVIFGHPDLWDDAPVLDTLDRYDCLVLAEVDCLSDTQLAALRAAADGGTLVLLAGERRPVRNENFEIVRAAGVAPGIPYDDRSDLLEPFATETDAPVGVAVTVRSIVEGRGLVIHLVDYGQPVYTGRAQVRRSPIRVRLPAGALAEGVKTAPTAWVRFLDFGHEPRGRVSDVRAESDGAVSFTVDGLLGYGAVGICDPGVLSDANAAADGRRRKDRERVKARWARATR